LIAAGMSFRHRRRAETQTVIPRLCQPLRMIASVAASVNDKLTSVCGISFRSFCGQLDYISIIAYYVSMSSFNIARGSLKRRVIVKFGSLLMSWKNEEEPARFLPYLPPLDLTMYLLSSIAINTCVCAQREPSQIKRDVSKELSDQVKL